MTLLAKSCSQNAQRDSRETSKVKFLWQIRATYMCNTRNIRILKHLYANAKNKKTKQTHKTNKLWKMWDARIMNKLYTYIVAFFVFGSFTMSGPNMNDNATPKCIDTVATAVAVARWLGGNQTTETEGGPWTKNGPAKAMKNWPILAVLYVNIKLWRKNVDVCRCTWTWIVTTHFILRDYLLINFSWYD